jgi:adenosylcobinamide-GDP ribazoletransferase
MERKSAAMTDTQPAPPESPSDNFRPMAELVTALRFLTRLPVPFAHTIDPAPLHQAMRMFAIAGAAIGLITAGTLLLGQSLGLPPMLAAAVAFSITLLVTGALHEDGFADMFDGFGGGHDFEHRLQIMRDSRIGSYGTLALIAMAAIRIAALTQLQLLQPLAVAALLAASAGFSRALAVDLLWATKPARADGLAVFVGRPNRAVVLFCVVSGAGLVLAAGFLHRPESGVMALAAALLVTAFIRQWAMRMIGGQTGDICGAVQLASELAMLSVFAAMIH